MDSNYMLATRNTLQWPDTLYIKYDTSHYKDAELKQIILLCGSCRPTDESWKKNLFVTISSKCKSKGSITLPIEQVLL